MLYQVSSVHVRHCYVTTSFLTLMFIVCHACSVRAPAARVNAGALVVARFLGALAFNLI